MAEKLYWKWEDEEDDGEAVGPVWISEDGAERDRWVRRSEAETYAAEHGLEFAPDE